MTDKTPKERVDEYRERNTATTAGMSEAPGIAFCTVFMDGIPVNLTARSMTPYDALASLKISINLAQEFLGVTRSKDIPQAAPPKKTPVTDEFDSAFPEPTYEDVDGVESSEVNSIKILPQPEERVTIEFMKDGMKYPVAKINKWPLDRAQGFLAKVTTQDVSKPAEVKVDCTIYWKQGKEFAPGKHYKDILKVE